jgi:hypothetical protein
MAVTSKSLARTAASTTSTTLYTVPSGTTAIITNIVVANTNGTAATFTLTLDGIDIIAGATVNANSTAFFDLKQVLDATKILAGYASATTVKFHVSGVEVA